MTLSHKRLLRKLIFIVPKTSTTINTVEKEIAQFLGIQMKMVVVHIPNYEPHWVNGTRHELIASVMASKRYKKLRQCSNANDNIQENGNLFFKLKPLLTAMRKNCPKIESERGNCIDEKIIPAKTKWVGIGQYNLKKKKQNGEDRILLMQEKVVQCMIFLYTLGPAALMEKSALLNLLCYSRAHFIPKHKQYELFLTTGFLSWIWLSNYKLWPFWQRRLLEQLVYVTAHWAQKKIWKKQEEVHLIFAQIRTPVLTWWNGWITNVLH